MKPIVAPSILLALVLSGAAGADETGTVSGRITSHGKPVPYAVVIADYQHADLAVRADANGRYEIAGVPTGNHDVFSFAEGGYIYDHGGFPKIDAGTNDHSRNLFHLTDTKPAPTVTGVKWTGTSGAPGATLDVSATWKAHDNSGISDEIFVYIPEFNHPARFGVGKTRVGKNPDGNYTAHLTIPADAKPGTYTAYVFGASESCYTNVKWPKQRITVK